MKVVAWLLDSKRITADTGMHVFRGLAAPGIAATKGGSMAKESREKWIISLHLLISQRRIIQELPRHLEASRDFFEAARSGPNATRDTFSITCRPETLLTAHRAPGCGKGSYLQ